MRILITNDDGVNASLLIPLIRYMRKYGEVFAVVPKYEQSGKSHGIELHTHFCAREEKLTDDITVWTVDSTPADCVRFAILGMKEKFDLVISGINKGLNIGTDMIYSGTLGAASEAVALGVKAIALSVPFEHYQLNEEALDSVFELINENGLLDINSLYNVNIPKDPKGIKITHQGGPYYSDDFENIEGEKYIPRGKCVYVDRNDLTLDTDCTMHGYISVSPLTINRTNFDIYNKIKALSDK